MMSDTSSQSDEETPTLYALKTDIDGDLTGHSVGGQVLPPHGDDGECGDDIEDHAALHLSSAEETAGGGSLGIAACSEAYCDELRARAEEGDVEAQYQYARLWKHGNVGAGIPRNLRKAAYWYAEAAAKGHALAQTKLASIYQYGKVGFRQDLGLAKKLLEAAANQGLTLAQFKLGKLCVSQRGTVEEGVRWYKAAAERGDYRSQFNLAKLYSSGAGVMHDHEQAIRYYQLAAEQGFVKAQYNLAKLYSHGYPPDGKPNVYEAIKWYMRSGEQGFIKANYNLGIMYIKFVKDDEKALHYFRLAAERNFAKAQFNLGWMLHRLHKNKKEAADWYREAYLCLLVWCSSIPSLARLYRTGEGVSKDLRESIRWYKEAATSGFLKAQAMLGQLYASGDYGGENGAEDGGPEDDCDRLLTLDPDFDRAAHWFHLASRQGDTDSRTKLVDLLMSCAYQSSAFESLFLCPSYLVVSGQHEDAAAPYIIPSFSIEFSSEVALLHFSTAKAAWRPQYHMLYPEEQRQTVLVLMTLSVIDIEGTKYFAFRRLPLEILFQIIYMATESFCESFTVTPPVTIAAPRMTDEEEAAAALAGIGGQQEEGAMEDPIPNQREHEPGTRQCAIL